VEYFLTKSSMKNRKMLVVPPAGPSGENVVGKAGQQHDYHIIFKRNLFGGFSQERKGAGRRDGMPENLETTRLNIVLKGTIHGPGVNGRRAVIFDGRTAEQNLYRQGDFIQDARIRKILRGKIILSHKGKNEILEMSETAGSAEPVAPVAVVPSKRMAPVQRPALVGRMVGSRKVQPRSPVKPRRTEIEGQPID